MINPLAKRAALLLFIFFQVSLAWAQDNRDSSGRQTDTSSIKEILPTAKKDELPVIKDSSALNPLLKKPVKVLADTQLVYHTDSLRFSSTRPVDFSHLPVTQEGLFQAQKFFNLSGKAIHIRSEKYEPITNDGMFYLLVGMLFWFALVKMFFSKYLANLLTLFFRASIRQQQLREQVLQSPFPSILLNVLFVFSGGLYAAFLMQFYQFGNPDRFWVHFLTCTGLLSGLYLLKFLILRLTGWIFNLNRAAEAYLFVVFMTNKIIGIFLLPFLVLIAFSGSLMTEIGVTLSIIMICVFYIYRFIASYSTLHKEIKISGLHFFLYLCAFEIAPLLLIYKVLVTYLEKAY
jgi:hypothetical protein